MPNLSSASCSTILPPLTRDSTDTSEKMSAHFQVTHEASTSKSSSHSTVTIQRGSQTASVVSNVLSNSSLFTKASKSSGFSKRSGLSRMLKSIRSRPQRAQERVKDTVESAPQAPAGNSTKSPDWAFHVSSPPECRAQASVASGLCGMMQWYQDHPERGQRPSVILERPVSLLDDMQPFDPSEYEQTIRYPAIQPALQNAQLPNIIELHEETLVEVHLQRDLALASLEGAASKKQPTVEPVSDPMSGTLIDFDEPIPSAPANVVNTVHPDLISLEPVTFSQPIPDDMKRSRKPAQKITAVAEKYFGNGTKHSQGPSTKQAPISVCAPLPVTLRVAHIEMSETQMCSPAEPPKVRPGPQYVAPSEDASKILDLRAIFDSKMPDLTLTCTKPEKPSTSLPHKRSQELKISVAQRIKRVEKQEDLCAANIVHSFAIDCPSPRSPSPTPQARQHYQPYRLITTKKSGSSRPDSYVRPKYVSMVTTVTKTTEVYSTIRYIQETPGSRAPKHNGPPQLPYLAYSKTVVRKGTLRQLGGRMVNIPSRSQPQQPTVPTRTSSLPAQTNPIQKSTDHSSHSPPEPATSVTKDACEDQSETAQTVSLSRSTELLQVTGNFTWPRFSDQDYEDPAIEYGRRQKMKRRKSKWHVQDKTLLHEAIE